MNFPVPTRSDIKCYCRSRLGVRNRGEREGCQQSFEFDIDADIGFEFGIYLERGAKTGWTPDPEAFYFFGMLMPNGVERLFNDGGSVTHPIQGKGTYKVYCLLAQSIGLIGLETQGLVDIRFSTKCPLSCTRLNVSNSKLTKLDVTSLRLLEWLQCGSVRFDYPMNPPVSASYLKELNTSNVTQLKHLFIAGASLAKLNISTNRNLQEFSLNNTGLDILDFSFNNFLRVLHVRDASLYSIVGLQGHNYLCSLIVYESSLSSLNLSGCGDLEVVHVDENSPYLETLNISDCPRFYELEVAYSPVKIINLANCIALKVLNLGPFSWITQLPNLEVLNLEGCVSLELLNARNSKLQELDLSDCIKLVSVAVDGNALTKFILKSEVLINVSASHNNLSSSGVDKVLVHLSNMPIDTSWTVPPRKRCVLTQNNPPTQVGVNAAAALVASGYWEVWYDLE